MLKKLFKSRKNKAEFVSKIDCLVPKFNNKVLFVVKDKTCFSGNIRVSLESFIKYSDKKIYFYKDGNIKQEIWDELKQLGVTPLKQFTLYSLWHILSSKTVIFSHNPRDAHITKKCKNRNIINLWHGVAIKKIELLMSKIDIQKKQLLLNNSKLYSMVIASSKEDQKTNAKAFGASLGKVKITGLPRYEILKEGYQASNYLKKELENIKQIKNGKKLVLYAPTFRENSQSPLKIIKDDEWKLINNFAKKNNIIFGIRPHPYDENRMENIVKKYNNLYMFNSKDFVETNLLLKYVDLLVVDFSSIWIDYLLLNRPIIGFSKDYSHYLENERGFVYNIEKVFPETFIDNIESLLKEIEHKFNTREIFSYQKALSLFHTYNLDFDFKKKIFEEIEKLDKQ